MSAVTDSTHKFAMLLADYEKSASTVISVGILLLVGFAAELSPAIAAVAATAPTGVPLSIFIVASRAPERSKADILASFTRSLIKGVLSTLAFAVAAHACAARNYSVRGILLVGYSVWAATWWVINQ